jgi:hypothetical protein
VVCLDVSVVVSIILCNETFLFSVLLALQSWIKQHHAKFIYFSAAAIIIFRAELAMFLGILLLIELINRHIHPLKYVIKWWYLGIYIMTGILISRNKIVLINLHSQFLFEIVF